MCVYFYNHRIPYNWLRCTDKYISMVFNPWRFVFTLNVFPREIQIVTRINVFPLYDISLQYRPKRNHCGDETTEYYD